MKTSLSKVTQLKGLGLNTNFKSGSTVPRSSSGDNRHPYLKRDFWLNPTNQFWNTGLYSQKSKDYFMESLQGI
jgi:hypothetical protein